MENGYKGKFDLQPSSLAVPGCDHGAGRLLNISLANNSQRGFTIIELMIVVVLVAVLAMIAVPSFESVIKRNRIEAIQSQFSAALATARTEATSRNALVTVCASDGGEACVENGGSWDNGWLVFLDNDGDNKLTSGDRVLEVFRNNNNYRINVVSSINEDAADYISYGHRGFLRKGVQPTLVTICEPDNDVSFARGLFVSASGTVMKTRDGADDDEVHDSPLVADADLSCN